MRLPRLTLPTAMVLMAVSRNYRYGFDILRRHRAAERHRLSGAAPAGGGRAASLTLGGCGDGAVRAASAQAVLHRDGIRDPGGP